MPDTVNSIVSKVQERFADAGSSSVIDYINRVHRGVVGIIPEVARHTQDITTLAAGNAAYDLPTDTLEVAQVLYVTDANTAVKLVRTNEDKLIEEQPTWEFDIADTPAQFYVQGNNTTSAVSSLSIYLYPKPDVTSSSGYPRLRCYITECKTLVGADSLPEGLATYDVYLEGACYYTADALRGPAEAAPYFQAFQAALSFCRQRWTAIQPQTPQSRTYPIDRTK
jgi:hypothetical protein